MKALSETQTQALVALRAELARAELDFNTADLDRKEKKMALAKAQEALNHFVAELSGIEE